MNETLLPMHEDSHIVHHFHENEASRRNILATILTRSVCYMKCQPHPKSLFTFHVEF